MDPSLLNKKTRAPSIVKKAPLVDIDMMWHDIRPVTKSVPLTRSKHVTKRHRLSQQTTLNRDIACELPRFSGGAARAWGVERER